MSFGFSVGDFIAAADLIARVVSALREAGGSASQHRHITNKLGFLDRAIRDVNRLEPVEGLEPALEAIKTTALSCQSPLLEYLENIRRYDKSLGPGQSCGVMKDVFLKMKWQVSKKMEAAMKLEAEIVVYLGAINLLLGLYKLKVDTVTEQRATRRFESLTKTIANLHIQTHTVSKNLAQVQYQVEQGTHVLRKDIEESSKQTSQALKSLQQNFSATVSGFLIRVGLPEVTLQTYSKICEIHNTVLWVRNRLSQPDTRHTWLQEPMRWEDAYGRVFPIPAEFDYPMMEGALRGHFRDGRGKKLVERNQWQLFDPSSPGTVFSAENWDPFPGMKITMAMIIPQFDDQMVCPRLNCSSKSYTDAPGGGKICSECKTWFDSLPPSSSPLNITAIVNSKQFSKGSGDLEAAKLPGRTNRAAKNGPQARDEDRGSDSDFEIDEEDLRLLKNARVRLEGPKPTSVPTAIRLLSETEADFEMRDEGKTALYQAAKDRDQSAARREAEIKAELRARAQAEAIKRAEAFKQAEAVKMARDYQDSIKLARELEREGRRKEAEEKILKSFRAKRDEDEERRLREEKRQREWEAAEHERQEREREEKKKYQTQRQWEKSPRSSGSHFYDKPTDPHAHDSPSTPRNAESVYEIPHRTRPRGANHRNEDEREPMRGEYRRSDRERRKSGDSYVYVHERGYYRDDADIRAPRTEDGGYIYDDEHQAKRERDRETGRGGETTERRYNDKENIKGGRGW
ncbi:hypothetical protein DL98DRAFT_662356, partial [Cadophora sp. DSE1049]